MTIDNDNPPPRKGHWIVMDARAFDEPAVRETAIRNVRRAIPEGAWGVEWEIHATWFEKDPDWFEKDPDWFEKDPDICAAKHPDICAAKHGHCCGLPESHEGQHQCPHCHHRWPTTPFTQRERT